MIVRSASGFGDAIFLNCMMPFMCKKFKGIVLRNKFPVVFKDFDIKVVPFKKGGEDLAFNYGGGARKRQETTIYQDLCLAAGFGKDMPYEITWTPIESALCDGVRERAGDRPIFLVSSPHLPFGRDDGRGDKMIPNYKKFQILIDFLFESGYYVVQVGKNPVLYEYKNLHENLVSKTTVGDVMNLGQIAVGGMGQSGFHIPLMEGNNKKCFIILARRGLDDKKDWFISNVTCQKILSKKSVSDGAVDDEKDDVILERFVELLNRKGKK